MNALTRWLLVSSLLAPIQGWGQDGGVVDKPYPLTVNVGEARSICDTGAIQCPAGAPICDDPAIAVGIDSKEGLEFKGLSPGSTLCSAASAGGRGARRVFRVTVVKVKKN